MPIEFRVLGPLEIWRDGERVAIPRPKQRALLGFLLLHRNEPVPQDELIDQLWGEDAPPSARASLQNQVHALRKIVGDSVLERAPAGYVVNVEPGQLDLDRFERLVAEARHADPIERVAKLREALALWRGAALVEFPTEPFAQYEINRLEEERLTALEERIDAELELGADVDLVAELEALVGRHPLRERLWAQLMLALYRAGRQADALAAYRRAHQTFTSDLGLEPGVVLRELQHAILVQDPALVDGGAQIGSTLERAAAILPKDPRERAESLYEYGVALLRIGERDRAVATLDAASRMAASAGAQAVEARARLYRSYASIWTDGKSPLDHLKEAEHAATLFERLDDKEGRWLALRQQAQILREWCGRPDDSLVIARRAAEAAASLATPRQHAYYLRGAIALAVAEGSTPVSAGIAECEAELAAAAADEGSPLRVWFALTSLYAQAGRIGDARALAERALIAARQEGQPDLIMLALAALGAPDRVLANFRDVATRLRSAHELAETTGNRVLIASGAGELACVLARSGEMRDVRRLADTARATAPEELAKAIYWRRALALLAAHDGRTDEALRLTDEALERVFATDWLNLRAETLEEAAMIREVADDVAGSREALRAALAAYERKENIVGTDRVRSRISSASSQSR